MSKNNPTAYGKGVPFVPVFPPPFLSKRAPLTTDVGFLEGQEWIDTITNTVYRLTSIAAGIATWVIISNGTAGSIQTITGDSGGAETPSGGNFNLKGTTNQVAVTGSSHTETISLTGPYTPTTYTAHGVLIGEGTSSIVATAVGTSGQVLTSNGPGLDPTFQAASSGNVSGPASSVNGDIVLFSGTSGKVIEDSSLQTGQLIQTINGSAPSFGAFNIQTLTTEAVFLNNSIPITISATTPNLYINYLLPYQLVNLVDEFNSNKSTAGSLNWGISGTALNTTTSDLNHPGILSFTTAATELGIYLSDSTSYANSFLAGSGGGSNYIVSQYVMNLKTLSNGTNRYTMIVGMTDNTAISTPSASPTNGVFFSYSDNVNSGNWVCNTVIAGTSFTVNTTVAGDTNFHDFIIYWGNDGSEFFIDGTQVAFLAHGVTAALTPCFWSFASVGNAQPYYIDFFNLIQQVTR